MSRTVSPNKRRAPASEPRKVSRMRDDSYTDCLTEDNDEGQTPTLNSKDAGPGTSASTDVPVTPRNFPSSKSSTTMEDIDNALYSSSSKLNKEKDSETPSPRTALQSNQAALATPAPAGFGNLSSLASDSFKDWQVGESYKIVKSLGHGSYGEVAEAIDRESNQKVAIKRIHHIFDQEIDTKRILREVYILRHLNHENVVQLLDILTPPTEDFNEIYLVFEFVDTDLHKLIHSPQYLTIEHVKTFLYQMLCALKYIHSSLVIHRDIKPANILLNEDCGLKICDFGLARVVPPSRFVGEQALEIAAKAEKKAKAKRNEQSKLPEAAIGKEGHGKDGSGAIGCKVGSSTGATSVPVGEHEVEMTQTVDDDDGEEENADTESKEEPRRLTRQLTKHVVTRWYRPPELILLQEYTNAVDMWSVGCIFAELLSMQKESVKSFKDRNPLFPGKSCFPLSADNERTYKDRLDQLNVIFGIIGTPQKEDIDELGEVKNYLSGLPVKKRRDFSKMFKAAPPDAIDLINKMLVFDPQKRVTVEQALDHPFLETVRIKTAEALAPEGLLSNLDKDELDEEQLRLGLLDEIEFFRLKRLERSKRDRM